MNIHEEPLFANGTEFMLWRDRNCDRCWKSKVSDTTGKSRCAIENAIGFASALDGTLRHLGPKRAARIAARLKWAGTELFLPDCPEREEKRPHRPRTHDMPLFQ